MSHGYSARYVNEEADYSESDCPSDAQVMQQQQCSDLVTELYRRKHQRNQPYYHHHPGYYETPPGIHHRTQCPCLPPPPDPRYYYPHHYPQSYAKIPQEAPTFRSTPHIAPTMVRAGSAAAPKKYPVTARTPRYYKCPTTLCKRPSTLCLPVTSQPDPAAASGGRAKRSSTTPSEGHNHYTNNSHPKRAESRVIDSEGDVNSRLNDLETLLTKFDAAAEDDDEDTTAPGNQDEQPDNIGELTKILKPKIPPSLKAKQQQQQQQEVNKLRVSRPNADDLLLTSNASVKLEVREAPDEPLDVLLRQFGREGKEGGQVDNGGSQNREQRGGSSSKEINQSTIRLNRHAGGVGELQKTPPLDDNSAIELHKSKSYIVSLIDKALSKELGTVPGDKCSRQEFLNMNPKRAVDLVNRHSIPTSSRRTGPEGANEKNSSLEVVATTSAAGGSRRPDNCSCKGEEPLYLKQLKQLRWSHLRHIQREAKRLADLERFLDSFGDNTSDGPS